MLTVITLKGSADPVCQFLCGQSPTRLDHVAFAMDPLRLNRVQPRALGRQETGQDTDSLSTALDVPVVLADPVPHLVTDVPRSVVPDQEQYADAHLVQLGTTPQQELDGDGTHGSTIDETQPHLFLRGTLCYGPAGQQAIAGQGLRLRVLLGLDLLD